MAMWVTFKSAVKVPSWHTPVTGVCIEGKEGEAEARALGEVVSIKPLPYPAEPRIHTNEDSCPSFCFRPTECQGRHSCPRSYACSE